MDGILLVLVPFAFVSLIALGLIAFSTALKWFLLRKYNPDPIATLRKEVAAKEVELAAENMKIYESIVSSNLLQAYKSLCFNWNKSESATRVEILNVNTEAELLDLQMKLPREWNIYPIICDCWVYNDVFYLLENKDYLISSAQDCPDAYNTEDKILKEMYHLAIPLESIHYYKPMGELTRSQHTIGGENISYTGASVSGIGFGEITRDPTFIIPDIYDNRYIVLYYKSEYANELQAIYLLFDSLDSLTRTIPKFEK